MPSVNISEEDDRRTSQQAEVNREMAVSAAAFRHEIAGAMRDRKADERDRLADQRDRHSDERERQVDQQEIDAKAPAHGQTPRSSD